MPALFSKKKQFIRFLISFAAATGAFFAGAFFFAGPRLGPHYDFLARYSRNPPAARDITIIETGVTGDDAGQYAEQILEPSMVTQVILTLTEFGSRALIVHSPVLGVSSGGGQSGAEIQSRFDEEFALLGQNIRNLFQGIRVGSIPPGESERYVEDLVSLSERGKDRLLAAFMRKDEAGGRLMERAADIFGQVWRSGDIRLPGPEPLPGTREENRWYTRAQPDGDGVFRRVAPALNDENATEHIAFAAFKRQFRTVNFVTGAEARNGSGAPAAPRLILAREGEERIIPLDMAGRVLFRKPLDVPEVQRIALQSFLDYERVDEELARLLQTAETRGYFAYLDPESYPSILYRYSQALREDMLENPGDEKKLRWLDFRGRYIRSLETLLNGPSETLLVSGYETLIARERLGRAGIDRIIGMRDEVIVTFARIREHYGEFSDLRSAFSTALSGASCIMGTVSRPTFPHPAGSQWGEKFFPPRRSNPTDAEVSAILANTLLTGSAVTPAGFNTLWPWCLGISGIVLFIIMKSSPVFTFVTGLILMLLEGTVFAFGFVFTAYWIDPLLPALTLAAGIAASGITAASMKSRSARRFRMAYRSHIAPHYLKQVIRMESPRPEETRLVKAAIIAVRWPDLRLREMRDPPGTSADELRAFREAVFRHFTRTGGVFLGAEGDLTLIAYGSPLERICLNSLRAEMPYEDEAQARSNHSPAAKAVGAVLDLIAGGRRAGPAVAEPWTFGIDSGECVFGWAEQGGYTAFGPPVIRARTLASLTSRYQARILVSAGVIEKTEGVLSKKIDVLRDREGTTQEAFYRLITEPAAIPGK